MNVLAIMTLCLVLSHNAVPTHNTGPTGQAWNVAPASAKLQSATATRQKAPNSAQAAAAAATTIDPAQEASIRKLLVITGASTLMQKMIESMSDSMRPLILSSLPPGEYRQELVELSFKKFQSKADTQELVGLLVPIYAKYLTKTEVDAPIQFYQTPLGQKALSILPQVMSEAQAEGKKCGERLGRDSMMEVLDEHPDLRKALEEAAAAKN